MLLRSIHAPVVGKMNQHSPWNTGSSLPNTKCPI